MLNSAMVASMLSQHANNKWQRVHNGVPIVGSQAADQKFTGARRYGVDPVVGANREKWNLLTAGVLRQHLECGCPDEAVWV
jgi:hypothetical protein